MDTAKVQSLVDQLEDNIDDVEEYLQPILSQSLTGSTKKLPLLDQVKLQILVVYTIESLLFSYLKLNDIDPKEHPVFQELNRVKQYFEKVKIAEDGPVQPRENLSLDKQAAARIIKHSLAGNDKLDLAQLEREAKEKLLAKRKLKDLETSMREKAELNDSGSQSIEEQLVDQLVAEIEKSENVSEDTVPVPELQELQVVKPGKKEKDKKKRKHTTEEETISRTKAKSEDAKAAKKARKKAKKEAKASIQDTG